MLHPAGHTLSPVLHARAYAELGLDARYEVFDVPPADLSARVSELRARPFRQLSVSLPHKQAVLELAERSTPAARRIGAANTLTLREGRLEADNTDWIGVRKSLEPWGELHGARALVVGAGGAARAAVYALVEMGCEVRIANRTRARAEELAHALGARAGELDSSYDLLLNATSVGMHPHDQATPVPIDRLRPGALVFDLVYAPLQTRLLREAAGRGCRVQDGLDMLVYQAVEQVRIWSGRSPDARALRAAAEERLGVRSGSGPR